MRCVTGVALKMVKIEKVAETLSQGSNKKSEDLFIVSYLLITITRAFLLENELSKSEQVSITGYPIVLLFEAN